MSFIELIGRRAAIVILLALIAGFAVPGRPATAQERPLRVIATTAMIADAARAIGGELVEARALMKAGIDPHAYRATRSDIAAMAGADLVLWNGLYLEAQLEDFFAELTQRQDVIAVAEQLPEDRLIRHDDYADKADPHIWMDPALWLEAIDAIETALIAKLPAARDQLAANAAAYRSEIELLAAYAKTVLASVPEASRVLVTAHDAFNYFGRAYGYEVIGIQGISTESEAGLNRIAALVDMLVARDVRAVFVETSVSDRNIRALIEGAAARGHQVVIGGALFSDSMGAEGSYEGSYLGMIDHNATVIARALGGDAPPGGRLGRLSGS